MDRIRLYISKKAENLISNMILISGCARSGTTILGKLIHSAKEVEYAFEPPTMFALIPIIEEISEYHWKMLFEAYCYEELMLGYIAGRNLNFNANDDSYIFNAKPREVIEARLKKAYTKKQLEQEVDKYILSVKMPDIVPFLPKFQSYYPKTRIVIIIRRANDVLNSIIKKKWFDNISVDAPDVIWPYRIYKNCKIPYWVELKSIDFWSKAKPVERAAYYYLRVMEPLDCISSKILVNYHSLVEQPELSARNLFEKLSLTYTDKTAEIISSITPTKDKKEDLISKLSLSMQKKIKEVEEKYFYNLP